MPISSWSRYGAVRNIFRRAEAHARQAQLRARHGGTAEEEECPPALAEVIARINAYADIVADAAVREAVPLPCFDGRPLTEEVRAGLDEFGMGQLLHDLAGLPFGVLGGRGAVLMEMLNRISEVDRETGSWMGRAWPEWLDYIPAFVAERAYREAAEEEDRRQRSAGLPRRFPGYPEY
jgi:hypothetical protein